MLFLTADADPKQRVPAELNILRQSGDLFPYESFDLTSSALRRFLQNRVLPR